MKAQRNKRIADVMRAASCKIHYDALIEIARSETKIREVMRKKHRSRADYAAIVDLAAKCRYLSWMVEIHGPRSKMKP